jgi:hypothetical protein
VVVLLGADGEMHIRTLALQDVFQASEVASVLVFRPDQVIVGLLNLSTYSALVPSFDSRCRDVDVFCWGQSSAVEQALGFVLRR